MQKFRVYKKNSCSYKWMKEFYDLYKTYESCDRIKNFDSVHFLVEFKMLIESSIEDSSGSKNEIHYFNKFFKDHNLDTNLILDDFSTLHEFCLKYRDNLPKKVVNDFFRYHGLKIKPEIDEGYTTEEIDNNLATKYDVPPFYKYVPPFYEADHGVVKRTRKCKSPYINY